MTTGLIIEKCFVFIEFSKAGKLFRIPQIGSYKENQNIL